MFRSVCNEKSPFYHASVVLMFEEALRLYILL